MSRLIQFVLFNCSLLLTLGLAQEGYTVSGTIFNWTAGEAEVWVLPAGSTARRVTTLATGRVDADGQFSVVLPPTVPPYRLSDALAPLAHCRDRSFTPADNVRMLFIDFAVVQDDVAIGHLLYETMTNWFEVGDAAVRWVFFSTDAEIRAVCDEHEGEARVTRNHELIVQEGWHELVYRTVPPSSPEAVTERVSTEPAPPDAVWRVMLAGGVGARFEPHARGAVVAEVTRNYPAELAGLQAGDVLVEVDGQDVGGMSAKEIALLIRGMPETSVTLGIQREGTQDMLRLEVVRRNMY